MGVPLNLKDIQSGFLSASAFNANNTLIEEALAKAINREGGTDNEMKAPLDMGLQDIVNAGNIKAESLQFSSDETASFTFGANYYVGSVAPSGEKGDLWYSTTTNELHYNDSVTWLSIPNFAVEAEDFKNAAAISSDMASAAKSAAETAAATATQAQTEVQNSVTSAENIFDTVSEAQAQTNAILGLGLGSSYVDASGDLILTVFDGAFQDVSINTDGYLTLEY